LVSKGAELIVRLYSFPLPVVVAAEGHSIAMGAIMLLAADLRIGKDADTKYGLNETAIGMVLPPFGMELAKARRIRLKLKHCFFHVFTKVKKQ